MPLPCLSAHLQKKEARKLTGDLLPRCRNLLRSSMPFVRKFFHYKQIALHFTGK
jgi:oligoribonuclease (3'-5' exoribonuclease)